jgi:hypothetical protein
MSNAGGVVLAMARRAERRIVEALREAGALSPDRAIPLATSGPGGRAALRRLVRRAAVIEAGGRFWLDEAAFKVMTEGRKAGTVLMVLSILLLAAVIFLLGTRIASAATAGQPAYFSMSSSEMSSFE